MISINLFGPLQVKPYLLFNSFNTNQSKTIFKPSCKNMLSWTKSLEQNTDDGAVKSIYSYIISVLHFMV